MTTPNKIAGRISLMAAGAAAMMLAGTEGSAAQQQTQMPKGWHKVCTKQQDVDICNVQNVLVDETGQIFASVNFLEVSGKVNQKVLQIALPTYRRIEPGVQLQIDQGQPRKIDFSMCMPERCIAEVPLSDEIVNSFKRGQQILMTSVNINNQPNPIPMELAGFTAAFDGDPLTQPAASELDTKVQDFVTRNSGDLSRRFQEAQDRAKQATE